MADTITTWTPISAPTDFQDDAVFNIDFKTKTVQVLVEQPIVAGENLSQFIKFQAPRYYDNIDLTEMMVNILYVSPAGNKGISAAVNTEYSEDMIRCGWLVPYAACPQKGTLHFVLEFVGADYTLKTTIASTPVLDSINDADVVPEPTEQAWYIALQANVSATLQAAQTALGRIESIFNALSTPVAASDASEMLDESTIYVYTGSEPNYEYGYWYYHDGTEWHPGGEYASTALYTDPAPTQGSTNAVSSGGVYDALHDTDTTLSQSGQAADAKVTGDKISGITADISVLPAYRYAGEIAETGNGFVSNAGVITANSNYKYAKYSLHEGTQKITIDSIYVTGTASNYSAFAFFDSADALISAVNNRTINPTSAGDTFTNVETDVPAGTEYVLITFGNMSSSTTFPTITEIGLFKPATNKRVFNNGLNNANKQFFYFHTPASELGEYTSLAFNAKFKTESPVLSYEVYFTGYDADYTNRTFAIYKTGLTKGINGNEVTIAENFQNTANSLSAKTYIGVVVNFLYAYSSETGARTGISNANLYAVTSDYCLLNDKELELAHYPASGFTTLSTAHTEHYNPLYGGFLCTIGDSLTAVYYKSEAESWTALIAKWNNMQYENKGVSGMPLAKNTSYAERCMCDVVDGLSASKFYTHIMVMGGANDYNAHTAIGENIDTEVTTFKGAVNYIIATLTQKFPNAHIVFGTTYRRNQAYADKPYADAMLEVCALHSIPCLNNYENSGVQFFDPNWMAIYGATNALGNNHLNAAGDLFVAPRFEHALKYGLNADYAGVTDSAPTQGSTNAVSSGGVYDALVPLDAMRTATSEDVGKALKAKTVVGGKVTEWEFGEAGGGDSADLINGYFTPSIEGTGNISRDDGSVGSDSTYSHSDYIDISGYSQLTTKASYDSAFNAFYDVSKNFVSAFVIRTGTDLTVAIPSNAVYMRVSTLTDRYDASFVFRYLARDNADKISALQDEVSALANQSSDYFVPPIISTGYISRDDGTEQASADYSRSDYVDISKFSKLLTVALADGAFNAFYNSSKQFIEGFIVRAGTDNVITLPANAAYMRVSSTTASYNNVYRFRPIGYVNAVRIADLEGTVDSLANQSSDYFIPPIEGTGNISRDNGAVVTNADYSHSGYVNIADFKTLTTYATVTGNFNAFYDANKAFISAFSVRAGDGLTLEIPDGAVYMRVSTATNVYSDTYIFGTVSHSNAVRIGELEDTVDGLLNGDSGEYFSPPSAGNGNISRNDGSIQSSNYLHSDYIDISQYSRLVTNAEVGSAFNAFYKADKTFIAPFSITAGSDKSIEVPFGAMYMRVSAANDTYDSVMKFRTLESITSDALPDYWYGHVAEKCESIRDHMNAIGRTGETFVFVTDIHWYQNQQKSPKLIKYLLNNLNINMVFLGGDLITEGAKADEVVESLRCIKAFQFPDVFTPMVFGNHDNNSNQSDATQRFDANTVYSLFFKGFEDDVTWMTDTESSFYFDKAVNKTRYIFLDMGDDGVSRAFTAFAPFRDALLSTPSGYKIVIVAHIIDYGTFTTSLTQMIDAYNARTTVTVNSVVCDFTSASGSVVICLGGHRHYDDEIATAGGVPITVTDCDAMLSVSNITETAGTITEQAFDVVSLDYTNNLAYYERVGRNKSRIIHLAPVSASTTLTTSLSGTVTWSSRDDSIATVSNGTITRVATGTVIIRADNGTETEIWVCNS